MHIMKGVVSYLYQQLQMRPGKCRPYQPLCVLMNYCFVLADKETGSCRLSGAGV